jgi:ribosomal protein S21
MGVRIVLAEKEPIGLALRRFQKKLERNGVTIEIRYRTCYLKPVEARRAKRFQKRFKARKATLQAKLAGEQVAKLAGDRGTSSSASLIEDFWKKTGKP